MNISQACEREIWMSCIRRVSLKHHIISLVSIFAHSQMCDCNWTIWRLLRSYGIHIRTIEHIAHSSWYVYFLVIFALELWCRDIYRNVSCISLDSYILPIPVDEGVLATTDDRWLHFGDHLITLVTRTSESNSCSANYMGWFNLCHIHIYGSDADFTDHCWFHSPDDGAPPLPPSQQDHARLLRYFII